LIVLGLVLIAIIVVGILVYWRDRQYQQQNSQPTKISWLDAQALISQCRVKYLSYSYGFPPPEGVTLGLKNGKEIEVTNYPSADDAHAAILRASSTCGPIPFSIFVP